MLKSEELYMHEQFTNVLL